MQTLRKALNSDVLKKNKTKTSLIFHGQKNDRQYAARAIAMKFANYFKIGDKGFQDSFKLLQIQNKWDSQNFSNYFKKKAEITEIPLQATSKTKHNTNLRLLQITSKTGQGIPQIFFKLLH